MKAKTLLLLALLILPALAYAQGLEVNPLLLKTSTKANVAAQDSVRIKNIGLDTVPIKITTKSPDFKLSSYGFGLLPEEEKKLSFAFTSGTPGVFTNEFFIRAEEHTVILPVIVEVESASVRFDSTVETLDAKRTFYAEDELAFSFTIFDLQEFTATNIDMEYYILNMENSKMYEDEEITNVKSQKTLTKKIQLPSLKPGPYVLAIKSRHGNSIGFSTLLFNIIERPAIIEKFDFKTLYLSLVTGCLNNGVCKGITISVALVLLAVLLIYIIEVVKLSRLPKKKIEKAMKHEEKKKKILSLVKRILEEAKGQKQAKEQERIEEAKRKKIIEEMLTKQRKTKPGIAEKKLFQREVEKSIKRRKKLIKERKEDLKRKKKIEKMLKK